MPTSSHFQDCTALLVTSLTYVSSSIISVKTFTFRLPIPLPHLEETYYQRYVVSKSTSLSCCRNPALKQSHAACDFIVQALPVHTGTGTGINVAVS